MPNKLAGLPALQAIDRRLKELEDERAALEAKVRPPEDEKKKLLAQLATRETDRKEAKKKLGMNELVLKEKEALLAKLDQQLLAVSTNREYAALQTEMGSAKADRSALEDKVLDIMAAIDEMDKLIKAEKQHLKELEKKIETMRAEIDVGNRVVNDRISALQGERRPATERIDSSVIELYDRVAKRHADARVISCVKIETAPNGRIEGASCAECGVSITTQELNRCMQDREIIVCRNCSRILYLE